MVIAMVQHWQTAYLCAAVLFAVATIVAGDHLRTGDAPAPLTRCAVALAAGALWPVILVGLAQWWAIRRVAVRLCGQAVPAASVPERAMASGGSR